MSNTTQVNGYEIHEKLGSGGFGAVYRAYQPTVGREVAIKIILPHHASRPEFVRRFEVEAQVIARLEHMNIVPLYDYWRDPDGAYLVMRYMRGGSLRQMIEQAPFELASTAMLLEQIAGALAIAHRNGVIHRDLKPENVLLDEDGNAYLADFGIAKNLAILDNRTDTGDIVGSPGYLAPEQARGETISPQTDVYSLGVMLYELLAGEHPFPNTNPVEKIYKHLNEQLPLLDNLSPDIEIAVNDVIQKATAKNPLHRYQNATVFAEAFRQAAALEREQTASLVEHLTPREQQVLHHIIAGESNRQIAELLVVEMSTVRWYIRQIYRKLNVHNRVQAIIRGRELNLVLSEDGNSDHTYVTSYYEIPDASNPYKGLRAFETVDSEDFFGRDRLIKKLISRLDLNNDVKGSRFLAVVGPSGSGKSSVVKAGLIPALWRGDLPGSENWYVADVLPGPRPLDELEVALTRLAPNNSLNLHEHLERDEHGLLRAAQLILPDDGSELLVVIDQFEEVFTLVEDEARRQHFLDLINAAVIDQRSRVRVVVTLRADFYDRPLQYPLLGDLMREHMETVLPLSAEELQQVILKPADKLGIRFEEGLVARIIGDVNYQPGSLPLLQYALTELFDRRAGRTITQEAYTEIGGTVGALAKRANELFTDFDDEGQEAIRQMFLRLVTLGEGTEDTRRRVQRSELLSVSDDPDLMEDVIDSFASYRLLALDRDPTTREPTVEVAHEAILREWERLRGWLNDSRDDIKTQRQLSDAAQRWQDGNRDTGHLLRGGPLTDFERWQETTQLALTSLEFEFLGASLADRERREAKEQAQAEREASLQLRARRILQGLVAVFVVATIISAGLTLFAFDAQAESDQARIAAEREAEVSHSIALASSSQEALNDNDTDLAIALAIEANRIDDPPPQAQRALIEAAYAPGTRMVLQEHQASANAVAFSGDGTRAISGGGHAPRIEGSLINNGFVEDTIRDFRVFIWDLQTGEVIHELNGHTATVWAVEFSPDGKIAVSGDDEGDVIFWDTEMGVEIFRYEHRDPVGLDEIESMLFSNDGAYLFIQAENRQIIMWDMATMSEAKRFEGTEFAFDAMNQRLISDGELRRDTMNIYDIHGQDSFPVPVKRSREAYAGLVNIGIDSNYPRFVYLVMDPESEDRFGLVCNQTTPCIMEIVVWDTRNNVEVNRFPKYTPGIGTLGVSHLDQVIYAVMSDQIVVLDALTGEEVYAFRGHTDSITSIDLSADGSQLLTASEDGTIRVWDTRNAAEMRRIYSGTGSTTRNAVSQDGTLLALSSEDRIIEIWDLKTNQLVRYLEGHDSAVAMVFLVENDTALISISADQTIRKWDVATGEESLRVNVRGDPPYAILSPDGKYLFTYVIRGAGEWITDYSHVVVVYEIATMTPIRTYPVMSAINFIPGGKYAISQGPDSQAFVFDLATGERIVTFEESIGIGQTGARVLPDGKLAIGAIDDEALAMWDVETGKVVRRFVGNSDEITGLEITPDGTIAVTYSTSGLVILWDVNTGQQIARFRGEFNGGGGSTPGFNGESVFFGNREGVIIEWDLTHNADDAMDWVQENRYIRELSCFEKDFYDIAPCRELEAMPVIEGGRSTQTPIDLYIPSETPRPTATPPPMQEPELQGELVFFTPAIGNLRQSQPHLWSIEVSEPTTITIDLETFNAVQMTLLSPGGEQIISSSEVNIGPIELPVAGTYSVLVETGPDVALANYFLTVRRE